MKKISSNSYVFKITKNIFSAILLFVMFSLASYAQPLVVSAGNPSSICLGGFSSIGGSPTAVYGTTPYNYSWTPTAGLSSATIANPLASPTVTTTYTVTVTDAALTSSTSTITVTVYPNPNVTVNSPTICLGSSAILTAAGATTYSWAPSTGLSSTATANPTANPSVTTTYTVTGTSSTGCVGTAVSTVTVNSVPPTPTAGNNGPLCPGPSLDLTASFIPGAIYNWSGPSGFSSSTQNPTIAVTSSANAGTYSVTATVGGCTSSPGSTNVVINALPSVNAGSDQTICFGSTITFSATAPGAVSYSWDFGDGGSATVLNPTYNYLAPGTYTATLTAVSSSGCSASDMITITVSSGPTLTPAFTNVTCNGLCDGTASVTVSGGAAPYLYSWSTGAITSTVTGLCAGTYNINVTDANGCVSSTNITITQPPVISPNLTFNNPACSGACNGNATASPTGGVGAYTYLWSPGGVASSTYAGLCAGNYTVTVTDANGCSVNGSVTLNPPSPLNVITSANDTICPGSSSVISATVSGGIPPYAYSWEDGVTSFSTSPVTTVTPATNIQYTVTVTDANGCTDIETANVIVSTTNIEGHITYSGGTLSSGTNIAVLFNHTAGFATFDTIQSVLVDGSGNYQFGAVAGGNYLVKVFPDTSVYPLMVPTYYGDVYLWDSATVIIHGCVVADFADLMMVEGIGSVGPGLIAGHISEGSGFVRTPGDPVPGIDIKLGRNPGGQLVTSTQTDSNGDYSFNNIPVNTPGEYYTIYVDIPGLERDSTYNIIVTSTETNFPDLNYTADSSSVFPDQTGVGITALTLQENKLNVFPNPTTGEINIQFTTKNTAETLSITDLTGRVIYSSKINMLQGESFKLNLQNLGISSGTYVMALRNSGIKYKIIFLEN